MKKNLIIVLVLVSFVFMGCVTRKVIKRDIYGEIDLSGRWNEYDSILAAKKIVQDCLDKPWRSQFIINETRDPVIIVGNFYNKSDQDINVRIFMKHLERELINSGRVIFVPAPAGRARVAYSKSQESMAILGQDRRADYMLVGSINAVENKFKRKTVILYLVNIELVDLITDEKVWIGQKEVKKKFKNTAQ